MAVSKLRIKLEIPEDNLDQEKINEIIDVFYRF